jgi:hypothetical protein
MMDTGVKCTPSGKPDCHTYPYARQQVPDLSTARLLRQTIDILVFVVTGTIRCLYRLTKIHLEAYGSIISLWVPFIGIQLCRLVLKVLGGRRLSHAHPE